MTFPGTVASLRQMWGRAGRRGRGLAVYVAGEDALDQFFCRHPDEFLERPVEAAILDHENEHIHLPHLLCAAHEGPIDARPTPRSSGRACARTPSALVARATCVERRGRFSLRAPEDYPAARVSLRSGSPRASQIVDARPGELLGDVELARACTTVHDGRGLPAHGPPYEVQRARPRTPAARSSSRSRGDWYTQPKSEIDTYVERLLDRREMLRRELSFGMVTVSEQVLAYQRKQLADHEVRRLEALDLPRTEYTTQALWYELTREVLGDLPLEVLLGSLHAAEHAQIAVLPLLAMCDRWDIGGLSTNLHPQTGGPAIFIYDGHPGGVGITRQGFARFEQLTGDAQRLIAECPCESGCPSCVQSPKCGNLNEPLPKAGALALLETMLAAG